MAGTPYALNHLAPAARDAARDVRDQLSDGMLPQHGPVCPPQITDTADLTAGQHVCSMSGRWFRVESVRPGDSHFFAREMADQGLSDAGWLPVADGWDLLTAAEVAAWEKDVADWQDRDAQDRADRWGGWWDDQD